MVVTPVCVCVPLYQVALQSCQRPRLCEKACGVTDGAVCKCQTVLSNSVGKPEYLKQVTIRTAREDSLATQSFIRAASSSNTTLGFQPRRLSTRSHSQGYNLMAPERVPMASS